MLVQSTSEYTDYILPPNTAQKLSPIFEFKNENKQIHLLNFLNTPKLLKQVTTPVYQINYQRKGACIVTIPQPENMPGCEVSPSTVRRCCLSDAKSYKLQFGSLRHFP